MQFLHTTIWVLALLVGLGACQGEASKEAKDTPVETKENTTPVNDPHSYARPQEARMTHLALDLEVDFEAKQLRGTATYDLELASDAKQFILDTRDLDIQKVSVDGEEAVFELGEKSEYMGQALRIPITPEAKKVTVHYASNPSAPALQWLEPSLTAGKEKPFLFSQSQAVLARTWIPCQDGPGMRFTYEAKIKVPEGMLALMSAENPQSTNPEGVYSFKMPQPIPAYLLALSVGDLAFKSVGPRTGVYAEPSVVESAAYEFAEMEDMLTAAENMYGEYRWGRYDLLVLPPSFPFGGMENPRLTFATPTILAGDRSLTALVAHELAHSWSGNLVTNQTWNDFWLNEGFTVYFENRIMEAVYGKDYSEMLALISFQDLQDEVKSFADNPKDTHLKLELANRDPDDGMNSIAYDKGYFFLRLIEETVGREKWDNFLKNYFQENAFKTMTTEQFLVRLQEKLLKDVPGAAEKINIDAWVYGPGIPENCPKVSSERYDKAVAAAEAVAKSEQKASEVDTTGWAYQQYVFFLRALPKEMTDEKLAEIDAAFGLSKSGNNEILGQWFIHVAHNLYKPAFPAMEKFLVSVGRRKFLTPVYKPLAATEEGMAVAKEIYKKARPGYHYVSRTTMDTFIPIEK